MRAAGRRAAIVLGVTGLVIGAAVLGWRAQAAAARPVVARPDWDAQLAQARRIDPHTATAAEWERLPGIGPQLARGIVAERERGGLFASAEDLVRVRGIGPHLAQRLRPYLLMDEAPTE